MRKQLIIATIAAAMAICGSSIVAGASSPTTNTKPIESQKTADKAFLVCKTNKNCSPMFSQGENDVWQLIKECSENSNPNEICIKRQSFKSNIDGTTGKLNDTSAESSVSEAVDTSTKKDAAQGQPKEDRSATTAQKRSQLLLVLQDLVTQNLGPISATFFGVALLLALFSIFLQMVYFKMKFKMAQRRRLEKLDLRLPGPRWLYVERGYLDALDARLSQLEQKITQLAQLSQAATQFKELETQPIELIALEQRITKGFAQHASRLIALEERIQSAQVQSATTVPSLQSQVTKQLLPVLQDKDMSFSFQKGLPALSASTSKIGSTTLDISKDLEQFLLTFMRELAALKNAPTQVNLLQIIQKLAEQKGVPVPESMVGVSVRFFDTAGIASPNTFSLVAILPANPTQNSLTLVFPHPHAGRIGQLQYWFNNFDKAGGKNIATKPAIAKISSENKLIHIESGYLSES